MDNGEKKEQTEQTNFKVAEIWIRDGQIMLDAPKEFWAGKAQALGVLELCKDIVKSARPKENRIIKPSGFKNFVRGLKRR